MKRDTKCKRKRRKEKESQAKNRERQFGAFNLFAFLSAGVQILLLSGKSARMRNLELVWLKEDGTSNVIATGL